MENRMDDLIRRQDAIDAIDFARRYHGNPDIEIWYKAQDVFDALNNVSSAQRDRKKAKWIIFDTLDGDEAHCSECHRSLYVNERGNGLPDVQDLCFCPFCGADMRGEQDG